MSDRYLLINSKTGGPAVQLEAQENGGVFVIGGISVSGLGLTTAGVSDSLDKRFVTDAELTALQDLANAGIETLLASTSLVDLNTATPTGLYTVPAAKKAIITKIVVRDPSTNLDTVSFSLGFEGPTWDNVIADATHVELSASALYSIIAAKAGANHGDAGDQLSLFCNTLQGAAATCTVDVFGYLVGA